MKTATLAAVETVYASAAQRRIRRHTVSHDQLKQYIALFRSLLRNLGPAAREDEFWVPIVTHLRHRGYELTSIPLPFSHPLFDLAASISFIKDRAARASQLHVSQTNALTLLQDVVAALSIDDANPLSSIIEQVASQGARDVAVALCKGQWCEAVQKYFASRRIPVRSVFSWHSLNEVRCYDELVVVGAAMWFPPYVFTAPRAPIIDVVTYAWIRDQLPGQRCFVALGNAGRGIPSETKHADISEAQEGELGASELLTIVDWGRIAARAARISTAVEPGEVDDVVDAHLYLLAGGSAVYLESDEHSFTHVIDLEDAEQDRIKMIRNVDLALGTYVLLRSEGSGDYVAAVADKLLGGQARTLRDMQRKWKRHLKAALQEYGMAGILRRLREAGSARANEQNLRNWLSRKSIKTNSIDDFAAIMTVARCPEDARSMWSAMSSIVSAHRQAGQQIRRLLIDQISAADLGPLVANGTADFRLPEVDGGSLTAYRIESKSPATFPVATSRLGRPFALEADVWRG